MATIATWDEVSCEWQTYELDLRPGTPRQQMTEIDGTMAAMGVWVYPLRQISPMDLRGQAIDPEWGNTADSPVQGKVWVAESRSEDRDHLGLTVWARG